MFLVRERIDQIHRVWRQLPAGTLDEAKRFVADLVASELRARGYSGLDIPDAIATILDASCGEFHSLQLDLPRQPPSNKTVTGMPQLRPLMYPPPSDT